jgi:UDP-N-acetylmuramoyl-L-alanyl-D-glutamate--2,6-diaminopimelate ligase
MKALAAARTMTKKRLIHVFGSAGLRDRTKRPLMGEASAAYADSIILTEEDYRTEDVNRIIDAIMEGIPHGKDVYREANRKTALIKAIGMAKPGDVVMVTGKGHEKSLCRGHKEYPWSDQKEIKKILRKGRV